jgi:hypothetical protein
MSKSRCTSLGQRAVSRRHRNTRSQASSILRGVTGNGRCGSSRGRGVPFFYFSAVAKRELERATGKAVQRCTAFLRHQARS